MLVKVKTVDDDDLWLDPRSGLCLKYHPSSKKPVQGVAILPGGKELFLTLDSFHKLMDVCNDQAGSKLQDLQDSKTGSNLQDQS